MEQSQQQFKCTGDCFKCQHLQRQYCAAQWSYNSLRMIESMQKVLDSMRDSIQDLAQKVEYIQGNEASLFNPTVELAQASQTTDGSAALVTDES